MLSRKKTIGILGGMGPLATADLFSRIIAKTEAASDQDHLHVIIDSNTAIPDRTRAILHGGEDPVPALSESACRLRQAGADFLIMPCNTAHYFYDAVAAAAEIPVLNMLSETAAALKERGIRKAGLLATDGTIQSGVYEKALSAAGIVTLCPDAQGQKEVMGIIYDGIKAGDTAYDPSRFVRAAEALLEGGADCLVLGCTELPLAFSVYRLTLPHIDPTAVLAEAAIRFAGGKVRPAT